MIKSILLISIAAIFAVACQSGASNTNSNVAKPANAANSATPSNTAVNTSNTNASNSDTKSTAPAAADSPTAAYKAAYAARKNKDIKALRQLLTKDLLEFFEIMGDGKPNPLDDGLMQLCETPQGPSDDVRNEKINGNRATLEFLNPKGEWITMDLVKEDGAWKLSIEDMPDPKSKK